MRLKSSLSTRTVSCKFSRGTWSRNIQLYHGGFHLNKVARQTDSLKCTGHQVAPPEMERSSSIPWFQTLHRALSAFSSENFTNVQRTSGSFSKWLTPLRVFVSGVCFWGLQSVFQRCVFWVCFVKLVTDLRGMFREYGSGYVSHQSHLHMGMFLGWSKKEILIIYAYIWI